MKTSGVMALVLLCFWGSAATASPQAAPVYQESGGIVVIEIESTPAVPGWQVEAAVAGFTGASYVTWRGPNLYNSPGSGVLAYQVNITTAGRYEFRIHNRPDQTFTGCFVRLDQRATQPGAFPGGWTRVFFSTPNNTWGWQTNYDVGTSHPLASFDLSAGLHTLEFSGRDAGVSIDRFHLYRSTVANPLDTSRPQSSTTGGNPPPPPPAGGPETHWTLDDGGGPLAADSSGNGHDAALFNGPMWLSAGRMGGALSFDGVDDSVDGGVGAAVTGQGPLTVLAWIRSTGTGNQVILQQRSSAGFNGEYQLALSPAGRARWWTYGDGAMGFDVTSLRSVNDGAWHHVAGLRRADGAGEVYIDGVLDASQAAPPRTLAAFAVALGADRRDNSAFFTGDLDDVRIYARALDSAEIATLAAGGAGPGPVPPAPSGPRTPSSSPDNNPCGCGSIVGGTGGTAISVLLLLAVVLGALSRFSLRSNGIYM